MTKYEYRQVDPYDYILYSKKAEKLLSKISKFHDKNLEDFSYSDIILYFEQNFNLNITFFGKDPAEGLHDESWNEIAPDSSWIKYHGIVRQENFCFLDGNLVDKISGVTIPDRKRTLIMISQDCSLQRLIFTILHELSHFYFHIQDENKKNAFVSLTNEQVQGTYPEKLLPFEDEANVIASLLFCPDEKLEKMLLNRYSFKIMCRQVKMSAPAMHNRLLNYINHSLKTPYPFALDSVWQLRKEKSFDRIIHRIKTKQRNNKIQENKIKDKKIESAYYKKLSDSSFWSDIIKTDPRHKKSASNSLEQIIFSMKGAASNLKPKNFPYLDFKICSRCNHLEHFSNNFCCICGYDDFKEFRPSNNVFKLKKEVENTMKYSKIETNENGTPTKCPKCEYENLTDDLNYCPICATFISNICLGDEFFGEHPPYHQDQYNACSGLLSGDHRYCTTCGSPTSYNEQNLLQSWEDEYAWTKKSDPFTASKFNDLPFGEGD